MVDEPERVLVCPGVESGPARQVARVDHLRERLAPHLEPGSLGTPSKPQPRSCSNERVPIGEEVLRQSEGSVGIGPENPRKRFSIRGISCGWRA